VIVGGQPDTRGVVAACSYEARAFGIHSAMPCSRAYRLCPDAVFVRPRFNVYREVSRQIQAVFHEFTELVEPLSLDEAYLDVSECEAHQGSATLIARAIKQRIKADTGLTASAGVSYNKFLAKTASDMDKPDGLYVILPDQGEAFVAQLPIGKFFGIGRVTEAKMKQLGIHNGADLKAWPLERLVKRFGKSASYYHQVARGIDARAVHNSRERKSIGSERTFAEDLRDTTKMLEVLEKLAHEVGASLEKRQLLARTTTIKVKFADFQQVTRSLTVEQPVADAAPIIAQLPALLARTDAGERAVRLLGVSVSGLVRDGYHDGPQMVLFPHVRKA
jgi:DNA polymerase-4